MNFEIIVLALFVETFVQANTGKYNAVLCYIRRRNRFFFIKHLNQTEWLPPPPDIRYEVSDSYDFCTI